MGKQYEQYEYFNGHRGIHVGNGIYQVDGPYVSEILGILDKSSTSSFSVLYKWIDYDADIIEIWYFRKNCDGDFETRRSQMFSKTDDGDLHYIEFRNNNEIGGVHR